MLLFYTVQFQALDDSVMTNVRNLNKKAGLRSPMSKENNVVPSPGSKRVIRSLAFSYVLIISLSQIF